MTTTTASHPISIDWVAGATRIKVVADSLLAQLRELDRDREPVLFACQSDVILRSYRALMQAGTNIDLLQMKAESGSRYWLERAIYRHDLPYAAEWLTLSLHAASGNVGHHITLAQMTGGKMFPEQNDAATVAMKKRLQEALNVVNSLIPESTVD